MTRRADQVRVRVGRPLRAAKMEHADGRFPGEHPGWVLREQQYGRPRRPQHALFIPLREARVVHGIGDRSGEPPPLPVRTPRGGVEEVEVDRFEVSLRRERPAGVGEVGNFRGPDLSISAVESDVGTPVHNTVHTARPGDDEQSHGTGRPVPQRTPDHADFDGQIDRGGDPAAQLTTDLVPIIRLLVQTVRPIAADSFIRVLQPDRHRAAVRVRERDDAIQDL